MSKIIHTLHDGTVLKKIFAKDLIKINVWKGNRIIDINHVKDIKEKIGNKIDILDNGYKIVKVIEKDAGNNLVEVSYLVDGQHRQKVLIDYYKDEPDLKDDFEVLIMEKYLEYEEEIIEYFNALNNTKPIQWSDPNLIINKYITALTNAFNIVKNNKMIRDKTTVRPYLSADKLREVLNMNFDKLKTSSYDINEFIIRVKEYNQMKIDSAEMDSIFMEKDKDIILRAAKIKFMLAVDPKLSWIKSLLSA